MEEDSLPVGTFSINMDIFLLKVSLRTDVIISRCGGNSNHQCSSVCLQNHHPPSSFILRLLSFSACFILCPRFERISISKCYSKDDFDLNYNLDYTGNNKPLKFSETKVEFVTDFLCSETKYQSHLADVMITVLNMLYVYLLSLLKRIISKVYYFQCI